MNVRAPRTWAFPENEIPPAGGLSRRGRNAARADAGAPSTKVCFRGQTGKLVLVLSFTVPDPKPPCRGTHRACEVALDSFSSPEPRPKIQTALPDVLCLEPQAVVLRVRLEIPLAQTSLGRAKKRRPGGVTGALITGVKKLSSGDQYLATTGPPQSNLEFRPARTMWVVNETLWFIDTPLGAGVKNGADAEFELKSA